MKKKNLLLSFCVLSCLSFPLSVTYASSPNLYDDQVSASKVSVQADEAQTERLSSISQVIYDRIYSDTQDPAYALRLTQDIMRESADCRLSPLFFADAVETKTDGFQQKLFNKHERDAVAAQLAEYGMSRDIHGFAKLVAHRYQQSSPLSMEQRIWDSALWVFHGSDVPPDSDSVEKAKKVLISYQAFCQDQAKYEANLKAQKALKKSMVF